MDHPLGTRVIVSDTDMYMSLSTCLLSWLEQDTSCPKCRSVLSIQNPAALDAATHMENLDVGADAAPPARRPTNHFFHFDGKSGHANILLLLLLLLLLALRVVIED